MKTCNTCDIAKPLNSFHRASKEKQGRSGKCKTCRSEYDKFRYTSDINTKLREKTYKEKYGISIKEYEEQLSAQCGSCAVCDKLETTKIINSSRSYNR